MSPGRWYLYVARCSDDSLYCGVATDVARRIQEHNDGDGSKYCRSRLPIRLVAHWPKKDQSEALRHEAAFKRLSKKQKEHVVGFTGNTALHPEDT